MKLIIFLAIVIGLFALLRIAVALASNTPQFQPLSTGEGSGVTLKPCPGIKPNCHFVSIDVSQPLDEILPKIQKALESMPGHKIIHVSSDYLYATSKTQVMGYIDDVECQVSTENSTLACRSASRIGHNDLGKNKKRLDELLKLAGLS